MKEQNIYQLLEDKMLSYPDYASVPVAPNGEELVPIPESDNLTARQIGEDMLSYTGEQVYVRQSVLHRLGQAALCLTDQQPGLQLEVVYGYRALEIQTKLFEYFKAQLEDQYSGQELLAAVHRLVAVPTVAGHPAGAAVDIHMAQDGEPLDFGTKTHDFVPDSYTFSPFINREAWFNRQLLRQAMMAAGFAPFDGEWWHFSYGDKEWARYYGKEAAMYEQVEFRSE